MMDPALLGRARNDLYVREHPATAFLQLHVGSEWALVRRPRLGSSQMLPMLG